MTNGCRTRGYGRSRRQWCRRRRVAAARHGVQAQDRYSRGARMQQVGACPWAPFWCCWVTVDGITSRKCRMIAERVRSPSDCAVIAE